MHYKKIVGEKVYLSPIDLEADVKHFAQWMNEDVFLAHQNGFYKKVLGLTNVQAMMETWVEQGYNFSIVRVSDDKLLGNIAIFNLSDIVAGGTVGIFIGGEENRGKGYGKEAMELLMKYAFQTLRFHFLRLEVFSFNEKAIEFYKKLGFHVVGSYREGIYHDGDYHDIVLMDLLEREYEI